MSSRWPVCRWFLLLSGLIPVLALLASPPQTMLLVYTLFVVAVLLRKPIQAVAAPLRSRAMLALGLGVLLSGLTGEVLAWANNYLARAEKPILFHPQLIPDLIMGVGFYGGWAVAWMIVIRYFRFSFREVFCTTGLMGIAVENSLTVLKMILASLLANPLYALMLGLYVFATYGSMASIPFVVLEGSLDRPRQGSHWIKYPLAMALMASSAYLLTILAHLIAQPLGLIPAKRSIVDHPFF